MLPPRPLRVLRGLCSYLVNKPSAYIVSLAKARRRDFCLLRGPWRTQRFASTPGLRPAQRLPPAKRGSLGLHAQRSTGSLLSPCPRLLRLLTPGPALPSGEVRTADRPTPRAGDKEGLRQGGVRAERRQPSAGSAVPCVRPQRELQGLQRAGDSRQQALATNLGNSSVQFSRSVVSDSLRPHGTQHARSPCPSPTPGVHPNPCPSNR